MKNLLLTAVMVLGLAGYANPTTNNDVLISKADITETDAFCSLIQNGDYIAVKSMIDVGTNVNRKSNGLTPLMFAARQNKVEIVKLLLAHGADLKIKSDRGQTALTWAKNCKAYDAVALLEEAQKAKKAKRKSARKKK